MFPRNSNRFKQSISVILQKNPLYQPGYSSIKQCLTIGTAIRRSAIARKVGKSWFSQGV